MARCVVVGPGPRSGLHKGRFLSASAGHRPGEGTGQEIGVDRGSRAGKGLPWVGSGEKLFACVPRSDIVWCTERGLQGKMEGSTCVFMVIRYLLN